MTEKNTQWKQQLEAETRTAGSVSGLHLDELWVPGLTIVAHPDVRRVGERVSFPELVSQREVLLSRLEPHFTLPYGEEARPLAETYLSRQPIVLRPGNERGAVVVDPSLTRTRLTLDGEPLNEALTLSASRVERGVVLLLGRCVVLLLQAHEPLPRQMPSFGLVGESSAIGRVRREIERVGRLEVPVLLRGETGTGKELAAQAIHQAGARREKPFLAVNMAAIPPALAASELFGASRGAYTGAERKKSGFFQNARGGTLFLDEIGETPPEVQVMLLRALESHEVQPVGSAETVKVDVRVLAATDADLEAQIESGRFRAPLLHRLAGYELTIPPLRERRGDIGRLFFHFLRHELAGIDRSDLLDNPQHPWPPAEVVVRLATCPWPGNVRQLRNAARRLAIAGPSSSLPELLRLLEELLQQPTQSPTAEPSGGIAPVDDQRSSLNPSGNTDSTPSPPPASEDETLEVPYTPPTPLEDVKKPPATPRRASRQAYRKPSEVSEEELLETLRTHRWELKPAAAALGISRASLYLLVDSVDRIRKAVDLEQGEIEEALVSNDNDLAAAALALEVSEQGLKRRMTALGLR